MRTLFVVFSLLVLTGCATTSTTQTVIKSSGIVVTTVNAGMNAWAGYTQTHKVTQAQLNAVDDAYQIYYTAALAEKLAIETSLSTTNAIDTTTIQTSMSTAEAALIQLLTKYLNQ